MSDESAPPLHAVFRPDSFFLEPFRGWGLTCDPRGRVLSRFEVSGSGRLDVRGRSAWVEQNIAYDNGRRDRLNWEIVSDDDGHYVGREHDKGLKAEGRAGPEGFCWGFRTPLPKGGKGWIRVDYTLIGQDVAIARARLTRLGIRLSDTTTFYRHV